MVLSRIYNISNVLQYTTYNCQTSAFTFNVLRMSATSYQWPQFWKMAGTEILNVGEHMFISAVFIWHCVLGESEAAINVSQYFRQPIIVLERFASGELCSS